MINIVAIDDERSQLDHFATLCADFIDLQICGLFDSSDDLLRYIQKHTVDAIFLETKMPGKNGLELANEILCFRPNVQIIFATTSRDYAADAFEINALDYLIKPLTYERLNKTIERIKNKSCSVIYSKTPFIQCYGGFSVYVNGKPIMWKHKKAKEILAYLVHKRGDSVSWEEITENIWGDKNFDKAHANFHTTMHRLRKTLMEYGISNIIECSRCNYRINIDEITSDLYKAGNSEKSREYMGKEGYIWKYYK